MKNEFMTTHIFFIDYILRKLYLRRCRKKWRKNNRHNQTKMMNAFNTELVHVGNNSYGELNITNFGENTHLYIGHYVSIAENVHFLLEVEHYTNHISTYPFRVKMLKKMEYEAFSKGDIIVRDDVWIGYGATVLSGVTIGQGAIIAAGAVVTKDVEPYSIVVGVPARHVRYRFDEQIISFLNSLDYSLLTEDIIDSHISILYTPIEGIGVDEIKKRFSWFPKKKGVISNN